MPEFPAREFQFRPEAGFSGQKKRIVFNLTEVNQAGANSVFIVAKTYFGTNFISGTYKIKKKMTFLQNFLWKTENTDINNISVNR